MGENKVDQIILAKKQHLLRPNVVEEVGYIANDVEPYFYLTKLNIGEKPQVIHLKSMVVCQAFFGLEMEVLSFDSQMYHFVNEVYLIELKKGIIISQFITGDNLENFKRLFGCALRGETHTVERTVKSANQNARWWAIVYSPCYDNNNNIAGVSFQITDITDRKTNEQELETHKKSLREVSYMQSHMIRGPLASILGLIEIFKNEGYKASKDELRMMEVAAEQLDAAVRLIIREASESA